MCDPQFVTSSPEDAHAVAIEGQAAVHYWNSALKRTAFMWLDPAQGINVPAVVLTVGTDITACGTTLMRFGQDGCIEDAVVAVQPLCMGDGDKLQTILRHELGHVIGLPDTEWETDLMARSLADWRWAHPVDASIDEIGEAKEILNGSSVSWRDK
jgi:hypothetical protein